ncbi:MAG: hypothetical protein F9K23_01320 [Bacteroidetes bacterium]|nr:MAG: hypothetical protein F9K23_01320 [Bacteroidota bacterium]
MKRGLIIVWLFLYTALSAVGLPLTVHYCEGTLVGVEVVETESCCGSEIPDDCCRDEHAYLKSDEKHPLASQLQPPTLHWFWLPAIEFGVLQVLPIAAPTASIITTPPHPPPVDIYVKLGNFRI